MHRIYFIIISMLFLSVVLPFSAQGRSLYWQDMQVTADLDAAGRLHVLEQQTIVFTGAWNGGERRFNLRAGQQLRMNNIYRLDSATGRRITLKKGNLARVDHWVRLNGNTLRWRARLPSDPPFNHTPITYILDYTLSGILLPLNNGYQLNHDFAFPDRNGVIERFSLRFNLDPAWQVRGKLPRQLQRNNLKPGQSVRLSAVLLHPDGIPAAVGRRVPRQVRKTPSASFALTIPGSGAPLWLRGLVIGLLWILVLRQGLIFLAHERKMGRFKALVPVDRINTDWLNEHVFSMAPELVGATWDKTTDASEVAAVLARMALEKKMKSRVEQERLPWLGLKIPGYYTLYLTLLVPRSSLSGYELELVEGLFVDGDETDTKKVKKYYRSKRKSFDPISKIREPLKKQVKAMTSPSKNPLEMIWVPTLLVFSISFFLLFGDFFFHQFERSLEFMLGGGIVVAWIISVVAAGRYAAGSVRVKGRAQMVWARTMLMVFFYSGALLVVNISSLLVVGSGLLCAAAVNNILNVAKTRDSKEGVRLRRYLASAREYLEQELKRDRPELEDEWFPWLIAFGLGPKVDSWFRQYGRHMATSVGSMSGTGSSSGFTGGGGQFGGGGATGAWSTAAGSMSTSSSSSSGGGFSGGGGSGGGGGGGF